MEKKREKLIRKILLIGNPGKDEGYPLVSVKEFFDGNEDLGSIGCNLSEHPGIAEFYKTFKEIKSRKDVFDVMLQINEIQPDDKSSWPFSDRVFIITSSYLYNIWQLVKHLEPSEVFFWEQTYFLFNMPVVPNGYKIVVVWWD